MVNSENLDMFLKEMGIETEVQDYQKLMILAMLNNPNKKYICVPRQLGYTQSRKEMMKNGI